MIGVLDLGMGNLASVVNAVEETGFDAAVVATGDADFAAFTHLVAPGVGQFAAAMAQMAARGLTGPVKAFAASGRPLLGLCVGMQILTERGCEGGDVAGLGLIPGETVRIAAAAGATDALPIPHMGWNDLTPLRPHPLLRGLKPGRDVYFVHSYEVRTTDPADVIAVTDYGGARAAMIGRGAVTGCQFHPEKSQGGGLQILENFCRWDGRC